MARIIPQEVINELQDKVSIVDVVSPYVDIQKKGKNYFGHCPFHEDNTPSFSVNDEKQIFHCFSCGRGGNIYQFLMDMEGYSFTQAVEKVAELSGQNVGFDFSAINQQQEDRYYNDQQERLIALHESLSELYHYLLTTTKLGHDAMDYLQGRGLAKETIEDYQIGLAPNDPNIARQHLFNKGFTQEELLDSGVFTGANDDSRDRFRGRIIFPLRDKHGKVVAFSGRKLPGASDDQAKYLNSPETELFNKSQFLFNLDIAQNESRRAKELVLYEGFMDVISAANIGLKNGVASMGTSLTQDQAHIIGRYSKRLLLAYDGDKAGLEAMKRALDNMQTWSSRLDIDLLLFPNQLDPDEFIQTYGADAYREFVSKQRISPIHFYRFYYRQHYSLTDDQGKLNYIQAMAKIISQTETEVEQAIYIKELAEDTGLSQEVLTRQIKQVRQTEKRQKRNDSNDYAPIGQVAEGPIRSVQKDYSRLELSEMALFYHLLYSEETAIILQEEAPDFHFETPLMQSLYLLWQNYCQETASRDTSGFLASLTGQAARNQLVEIMAMNLPAELGEGELDDLVFNISTQSQLQAQMAAIDDQLSEAKLRDDLAQINDLHRKKIEILKQLKHTKR